MSRVQLRIHRRLAGRPQPLCVTMAAVLPFSAGLSNKSSAESRSAAFTVCSAYLLRAIPRTAPKGFRRDASRSGIRLVLDA